MKMKTKIIMITKKTIMLKMMHNNTYMMVSRMENKTDKVGLSNMK
jgi:hypothetical protein